MDLYFYSAFPVYWPLKAALQHLVESPIHTHIHTLMAETAMQGGAGIQTSNHPITRCPTLPAEQQPPNMIDMLLHSEAYP